MRLLAPTSCFTRPGKARSNFNGWQEKAESASERKEERGEEREKGREEERGREGEKDMRVLNVQRPSVL